MMYQLSIIKEWYENHKDEISKMYRIQSIPKRDGSYRTLEIPDAVIAKCQKIIKNHLEKTGICSPYAAAYQKKKSMRESAVMHVGQKLVLKLDIEDFFGSITEELVKAKVFPIAMGDALTGLCCYRGHLPQGACTSPIISNLVMYDFDMELGDFCMNHGILFCRYSDDMIFSGDFNPSAVIRKVKELLAKMGMKLNHQKISLSSKGSRQMVLGIVVNQKPQLGAEYRRKIRQAVYHCEKHGVANHIVKSKEETYIKRGQNGKIISVDMDGYLKSLLGKIHYALHINPNDRKMMQYCETAETLQRALTDCENPFLKTMMRYTMNKQRTELHIHTNMSEMDGVSTATEYIDTAIRFGWSAVAITDHQSVQALPQAYHAWEKSGKKVKLIYGMEASMLAQNPPRIFHATILVKNKTGLKNLYQLIGTEKHSPRHESPFILQVSLEQYREGLLIGSGCDKGELYRAISKDVSYKELCMIASFYDYLEIIPAEQFEGSHFLSKEELMQANEQIVQIGKDIGKPVVAVNNAHCIDLTEAVCRSVLLDAQKRFEADKQLLSTDEMLKEFAHLGEETAYKVVIENPNLIARMIDDTFPLFEESPKDSKCSFTTTLHPKAPAEALRASVMEAAIKLYGTPVPQPILERIDWEFSAISQAEPTVFQFRIGEALVKAAKQKGQTVGNRGPISSSLIARLLGITPINPLMAHYHCPRCHYVEFHPEYSCGCDMEDKLCPCGEKLQKDGFSIPPETLFGDDGSKEPDIDYNIAPEYLKEALCDLEKALGVTIVQCGTISTISHEYVYDILSAWGFFEDEAKKFADKLADIKYANDIQPGRYLIFPEGVDPCDYTPVIRINDERVTHLPCHYISGRRFFYDNLNRLYLLPHRALSLLKRLEEQTKLSPDDIPFGDEKTMELFQKGNTLGISEFSSSFVREDILKKVCPQSFDDLIRISAISHGTDTWTNNAEQLIAEGKTLREIASSRDDITLTLIQKGISRKLAFRISERIRKGKGMTEQQYAELLQQGIKQWQLDFWNKIRYAFPRAHSASYVLTAYRLAYYKAHYPSEFHCAYFAENADYFQAEKTETP